MLELKFVLTKVNSTTVLHAEGEIDLYTAPQLRDQLDRVLSGDPNDLVVDLAKVEYMDSNGLITMVDAKRRAEDEGRDFSIVCTHPQVLKVLKICGLLGFFRVERTLATAMQSRVLKEAPEPAPARA